MIQEHREVQFKLTNTTDPYGVCDRCGQEILPQDDPEHVIVKTINAAHDLRFHITPCLGEFVEGMVQFFKVFIVEKQKKVKHGAVN